MTQWDDPQSNETRRMPRQVPYEQSPYGQPAAGQPQYGQSHYDQPQYDRTQYEQPGHGQLPPGPPGGRRRTFTDSTANPFGAASDQAFGIVGTVLALLGGILGIVTLTGLEWFKNGVTYGDVGDRLDAAPGAANAFSHSYFTWLAWAFLIVAVIAGVMSSFPSPALRAFRVLGVVVGFAAAGLSFLALQLFDNGSWTDNFQAARIGFYLMVVAYLLTGTGAAIGPRKV